MNRTKQIFSATFVVLGVLLIVRGASGGLWPLSVQMVAGVLLVVIGVLRLRYL